MKLKLFWKLGLTYFILLLLALVSVYLYTARLLRENSLEAGFEQLEALAALAESRLPSFDDDAELESWTTWMAGSGARITVIAQDGRVLVDSERDASEMENHADRTEFKHALAEGRGREVRYSETLRRDLVYVAVRRQLDEGRFCVIRLAMPLARVNEAISAIRAHVAAAVAIVLVLGAALSLVFSRMFSSRVGELMQFSRRVAEGDFRLVPVESRGDELVELARALNETAVRLDRTIDSLEEQRDQLAVILGSMSEGVVLVGPDERIVFCNQAFRRILQLDLECAERPLVELIRHADLQSFVQAALSRGEQIQTQITVGTTRPRSFLVKAAPAHVEGARGALLVLMDITEILRLERVRRDFVANLSHEMKTPLTAIQGFTETLLEGALEDRDNRQRFLMIIKDHARRLGRLTDDLLKLSQIEAGKVEMDLRPLDVYELIQSCVETARLMADAGELAMEVVRKEEVPAVQGDQHALREVLQNLLDNAVQYTPPGGQIRVSASAIGGQVQIEVSDTGIGIPEEHIDRIFERFYRVDAARSRQVGGTGLGLSIAKHLIEAQGGSISVRSAVGQGSTFVVCLPVAQSPGL